MIVTPDQRYLFLGCDNGVQIQICLQTDTLVKNHGRIFKAHIYSFASSNDSKRQYIGDIDGHLLEWNIENTKVTYNFGRIHEDAIKSMEISGDILYTSSSDKTVKEFSVNEKSLLRNFGRIHKKDINSIVLIDM